MSRLVLSGVEDPEGPVSLVDGGLLFVEMSPARHCVVHMGSDGRRRDVITPAGRPSGLAVDGDETIWIAEASKGELLAVSFSGEVHRKIVGDAHGRFLWPNDIAFAPDGLLYMTDSGITDQDFIDGLDIRADFRTAHYDGRLYEIDPRRGAVRRILDRGLRFANGIAFGPDGLLYVAETLSGNIFAYDRSESEPQRRLFGNCLVPDNNPLFKGPDGIKFGVDGRLYCAVFGQGVVAVLDREGHLVERIPTAGLKPTNIAFHRDGRSEAIVTEVERSAIETLSVPTGGLPLHYPRGLLS